MIPDKILYKIESELHGKPTDFTLIGKGSNYDVYKFILNDIFYVLRFQKRATYDFSPIESELLIKLDGNYSPKLFLYDSGELVGSPFMVQSFISGIQIEILNDKQLRIVKKSIDQIHEKTIRKPHHHKIKDYYTKIYEEKFSDRIIPDVPVQPAIKNQIDKLIDKLHEGLQKLPSSTVDSECLIHGDLNHTNLLWQNDIVYFIDWEQARYSIPAIEFGGLLYCHGKTMGLCRFIIDLFENDEKELIQTGFYQKLLDSLCWRIKYLHQINLDQSEHAQQLNYLYQDLEKINYLN